jgi:hypothetical protein
MGWARHLVLPILLMLAAACSMEAAIEKLSSPEDRAFAMRFVDNVRSGDEEALKPQFDAELWTRSREQLAQARPLFPPGRGSTRLISYHVATNMTNGASATTKEFILVTTDQTHWTRTRIVTLAEGGPARVMEWNVDGSKAPPPELVMMEAWTSALPFVWAGVAIVLVGGIGLVWWLVRRSRRRDSARLRGAGGPG